MKKILQPFEVIELECSAGRKKRKQILSVQHLEIENNVMSWVYEVWDKQVYVTDGLIQARAQSICTRMTTTPISFYGSQSSNGWLNRFKKRNSFKSYRCHGESGGANTAEAELNIPYLRALVQHYGESNVYNADGFDLRPSRSPDRTIGPAPMKGRKKNKTSYTFLLYSSADSMIKLPLY